MGPPPVVTGISPKEGPPGTRVIVRGEFLGNKAQDLIGLTICGCDCLLSAEWKSSNKIIARSGPCKGRGDIIVTTRSGGPGTSTVQFRGYHETIGPMKESAVWVEEAPMQSFVWGRRTLSPTNYQQEDPLGLSVEGNDKKFPEDELMELFGEGSGDLTSEKFHPGWFLLQHHHATTFEDLKAGLAYLFEEMVIDVAKRARDTVVACGPREEPLFANTAHQLLYYRSIEALFTTFARFCLQRLAFSGCDEALDDDEPSVSQLVGSPSGYKSRSNKHQGPVSFTAYLQRGMFIEETVYFRKDSLLISLSNIRYTLNTVLPRIGEALKDQGYPCLSNAIGWSSDWTQLSTLDTAVLDAYLERRCDPLVGTIEPSMYLGGLEWDFETEPTHVKPYAQEILANLIAVHAEVRRVAPALLQRVLSHIVETVAEELARLMSCVTQFGPAGIVQARTDITLLRSALQSYSTPRAKDFFEEALDAIPKPVNKDDYARIDMLFVKVKTSMHLQLSCLANDATNNTPINTLIADPNRVTTV